MTAFLRLIRWPNLIIIILTMVLVRYGILEPLLGRMEVTLYNIAGDATHMVLQLPLMDFILLVAATVLISAGGYVINDYFDIKTDLINKGEVIVGTKITRRKAMSLHNILNIAGVAAGFYVSWKIDYLWLGVLFLVVSGLLYFYSASYKREFLIGNLIVAVLTAMVPMLVVIFEAPSLFQYYYINAIEPPRLGLLFFWTGGFAVFAFLTTLSREIIKDIEDFEGDVAYGRNTIPIVTGILTSKIIAVSLIIVTLAMLYVLWYLYIADIVTLGYITVAIAVPLLVVICRLLISKYHKELHSASRLMKIVMIAGILYSLLFRYMVTNNLI
jgi:4-hydroxybenzoate polyprenyltransferase